MLECSVKKKFDGFFLDADFSASPGITGLLGASGTGKSMILRCIAGIEKPDSGKIILNKTCLFDSYTKTNMAIKARKVGLVFQSFALFPHMTVEKNIAYGISGTKEYKQEKTAELISRIHLQNLEKRFPHELSGGQQQRVALARALATTPEILLLDEPFSALDDHLRSKMLRQLMVTLKEFSIQTLIVSHNIEEIYRACDSLVSVANGRVEAFGDKKTVFQAPPTVQTALLTGCKNVAKANRLDSCKISVPDWGIHLDIGENNRQVGHIGMRAHHINISDMTDDPNSFPVYPAYVSEAQFSVTLYLKFNSEPEHEEDFHIQCEMDLDRYSELRSKAYPWRAVLPADRLILIEPVPFSKDLPFSI